MANFGALTDHFSVATADLVLVDSSAIPVAQTRADAQDESGDIAASDWHGNTTAGLSEASCTYALKSGTLDLTTLVLGQISEGVVALNIEVATSNGAWPQVTVSGITGSDALEQVKTYALIGPTINGKKIAQVMGVAVTTGKLTDCNLSASVDWAQQEDGVGEPAAYGVSGGMLSSTATAVGVTAEAPVLAAAATWTISQATSLDEPQATWHTASITVEQALVVAIA